MVKNVKTMRAEYHRLTQVLGTQFSIKEHISMKEVEFLYLQNMSKIRIIIEAMIPVDV